MMRFATIGGMLLFWIVLVVLAALVVRVLFQAKRSTKTRQPLSPRQIVEQRYARGEITREQFLLMIKDLE